jgi:hypothetical protein
MGETPSAKTAGETGDAGSITLEVETDGLRRHVTVTVSPQPTEPDGWAKVVKALSDFVSAHPERF